jgi:hypothetical protein
VKSLTVMSVTCDNCDHFWAADFNSLPREIQEKIRDLTGGHPFSDS